MRDASTLDCIDRQGQHISHVDACHVDASLLQDRRMKFMVNLSIKVFKNPDVLIDDDILDALDSFCVSYLDTLGDNFDPAAGIYLGCEALHQLCLILDGFQLVKPTTFQFEQSQPL